MIMLRLNAEIKSHTMGAGVSLSFFYCENVGRIRSADKNTFSCTARMFSSLLSVSIRF